MPATTTMSLIDRIVNQLRFTSEDTEWAQGYNRALEDVRETIKDAEALG